VLTADHGMGKIMKRFISEIAGALEKAPLPELKIHEPARYPQEIAR
jgi:hypothetical protein